VVDPGSLENFGSPCYESQPRQLGYDGANLNVCENLYGQVGAVTSSHFAHHHTAQYLRLLTRRQALGGGLSALRQGRQVLPPAASRRAGLLTLRATRRTGPHQAAPPRLTPWRGSSRQGTFWKAEDAIDARSAVRC
jgi:hypothetical protein